MKKLFITLMCVLILAGCSYNNTPQSVPSESIIEFQSEFSEESEISISEPESIPEVISEPTLPPRENVDFRQAKWGDSPETVILYETADFADPNKTPELTDNKLLYTDKIAGLDSYIMYYFDKDQGLYKAQYGINVVHTTAQLYINDYNNVKEILTEKYDEPYEDEKFKLSSLADYSDDAGALQLGHIAFRSQWKTETTNIRLGLISDNYKIIMTIVYDSLNITIPTDTSDF